MTDISRIQHNLVANFIVRLRTSVLIHIICLHGLRGQLIILDDIDGFIDSFDEVGNCRNRGIDFTGSETWQKTYTCAKQQLSWCHVGHCID